MSDRNVLVTGGAGFIGSHLCEALLGRGDRVTVIDNLDPYYDPSVKIANLARSSRHPAFEFVKGDIRNTELLDAVFSSRGIGRGRFDVVVHLAARAGVRPSLKEPALYDDVNIVGTTRVLQACRDHGVGHIVFGSSSSVYGATSMPPFRESDPAASPSSPYASTKRANELACYAHNHLYGQSISCLRFFTVYGPRQRPEMAIHQFTRLIASGKPVRLFGDGTSRRDYTYVSDIVKGILAAVDRPNGYRIYNLGTTDTTQLRELVTLIGARLGEPVLAEFEPFQSGDVPLTHADISLAATELGYAPQVRIEEGLERFVLWFRDVNGVSAAGPRVSEEMAG
jgi:UDP-glucuronate 4-epimerase